MAVDSGNTGRERLRAALQHRGWSYTRLIAEMRKVAGSRGEQLPKTDSLVAMLSRWLNDRDNPSAFYQEILSEALQESPGALGLVAPSALVLPDDEVAAWELTQVLETSNVGPQTVERLEIQAIRLGQRLPEVPAAVLLGEVRRQFRDVVGLLRGSQPKALRDRLCTVAGQLAGLTGVLSYDLRDTARAEEYYAAGLYASRESGDVAVSAYLLGNRSLPHTYGGDPRRGVELLQGAQGLTHRVGRATSQRAWLAALEAEAHALMGDQAACRAALARARDALEQAQGEASRPGIDFFSLARLAAYQTSCEVMLRDPNPALASADEALGLLDPRHTKSRAFVLLDLATAHVQRGDLDVACATARAALTVASESQTPRLLERGREFRGELAPFASEAIVRDLDEEFRHS